MKILLTGANGLLGQQLVKLISSNTDHQLVATGKGSCRFSFQNSDQHKYIDLDITDGIAVTKTILAEQPGIILHTAAMTQVDSCELNPVACWDVNVTGTRFLIEAAKQVNAFFLFVSTDFVFDGSKGMYKEEDAAAPVNYYGSSKLAAEKSVMESGLPYSIVRTCLVYGNILSGNRSNIISWVKNNLEKKDPIRVVNDQWRTPTYVEDLANGILLIINKKATGIFHISGAEIMTPYDIAVATADFYHLDKSLISAVTSLNFTQPAKRPAKTGFDISKAKVLLGFIPVNFKTGLEKMNNL
jgi:dTDP-4-dehydrorhamnose reductase